MKLATYPRYVMAADFDEKSEKLSMRRSSWTVASSLSLLQLETSFLNFAESISLPESEASSAILELLANGLIHENHSAQEVPLPPGKSVRELLKGSLSTLALGTLGNDKDADQVSTTTSSPTAVHICLGEFPQMAPKKNMIIGWISDVDAPALPAANQIAKHNAAQATNSNLATHHRTNKKPVLTKRGPFKPDPKRFKLQPIISQIEKLSKGGIDGNVLAYQVFLKVPGKLLKDEGIESLHLVDSHTEFSDQKLCQAIIRATTEITGYNLKIEGYNQENLCAI